MQKIHLKLWLVMGVGHLGVEKKSELGVVLNLVGFLFANITFLSLTSFSPSFMAVPFFIKLLLDPFQIRVSSCFNPPAKEGFHHRVNLLWHVFDQQRNPRADAPETEVGKTKGRATTFPPSQDSSSGRGG